jgi:hypothetical protein
MDGAELVATYSSDSRQKREIVGKKGRRKRRKKK